MASQRDSSKHWHKTETRLIPDNRDKMFEVLPVVGINQSLRCFLHTTWWAESQNSANIHNLDSHTLIASFRIS